MQKKPGDLWDRGLVRPAKTKERSLSPSPRHGEDAAQVASENAREALSRARNDLPSVAASEVRNYGARFGPEVAVTIER